MHPVYLGEQAHYCGDIPACGTAYCHFMPRLLYGVLFLDIKDSVTCYAGYKVISCEQDKERAEGARELT